MIGSELRGLTRMRDSAASYPAIAALKTLAADVRAILPGAKIGYAADWSEYAAIRRRCARRAAVQSGSAVVGSNIDFIGIDNYMPLADWRDGAAHADYNPSGPTEIYDRAYLTANIRGGEDYDWFYASPADRDAQTRTPITDGLGKPWVWRAKDLWNWWSNAHIDRPAGTETTATAWAPQSKPIWFTELGCPAVDKGANQPNVFVDPKSAESALPYYSPASATISSSAARSNPTSPSGPMPPTTRSRRTTRAEWSIPPIYMCGCWDARPFPFFPALSDAWATLPTTPPATG